MQFLLLQHSKTCYRDNKFTGKERDTESWLDYFGARYYSSTMGRRMSPDWADKPEAVPYSDLHDPQSLNLYGYVRNNPLSRADMDGHVDWTAVGRSLVHMSNSFKEKVGVGVGWEYGYRKGSSSASIGASAKAEFTMSSNGVSAGTTVEVGATVKSGSVEAGPRASVALPVLDNNQIANPEPEVSLVKGEIKNETGSLQGEKGELSYGVTGGTDGVVASVDIIVSPKEFKAATK